MKKKKVLMATIAAASLALSCGAFAACGHSHTYSKEWDKDATGHWHYATCDDLKEGDAKYKKDFAEHVWGDDDICDICNYKQEDPNGGEEDTEYTVTLNAGAGTLDGSTTLTTEGGKLASLPTPTAPADSWFKGWYTEENGSGTQVTNAYTYTEETTLYAYYVQEATITLNVGTEGALADGVATTVKTVNGKLANLPTPTVGNEHIEFDAWYTTATGGVEVTANYEFTENATIYARYLRDTGVWKGDEFVKELSRNTGCTDHEQYWLSGGNIELAEGDEISIYLDGELMTYTVFQTSSCIEVPASSARVTSVTVSTDATFVIYLNKWGENNWQVEYTGQPLHVDGSDEIPEGCEAITLTFGNGTVTLYIIDKNGDAVNSENAANYQIHAWQTGNAQMYGAWATNPTLADTDDLVLTDDLKSDVVFMFHWSGGQSGNITNIEVGKAFIVDLRDNSTKEYTGTGNSETPDPEPDPEVDE